MMKYGTTEFAGFGNLEELIASYIEDNLTPEQETQIEELMDTDPEFLNLLKGACDEVLSDAYQSIGCDSDYEPTQEEEERLEQYRENFDSDSILNGMGAKATSSVRMDLSMEYTDVVKTVIDSQRYVLCDFGAGVTSPKLQNYAHEQGWYKNADSSNSSIEQSGLLLDAYGINVNAYSDCDVFDLMHELGQGHRSIIILDVEGIRENPASATNETFRWINDVFKNRTLQRTNFVASVKVDLKRPTNVEIVLRDPISNTARQYSLNEFYRDWENLHFDMLSTTSAAPFQYDDLAKQIIPSGFTFDQYVEADNAPVSPDIVYTIPRASNVCYKDGHLEYIINDINCNPVKFKLFSQVYQKLRDQMELTDIKYIDQEDSVTILKVLFTLGEKACLKMLDLEMNI